MKIRRDFVTNSSSSSFIIAKKHLDEKQILAIWRHSTLGEKLGIDYSDDLWSIDENDNCISGYTSMDNFDMFEFLEKIDVNMNNVDWSEFSFDMDSYNAEEIEENSEENEDIDDKPDWRSML